MVKIPPKIELFQQENRPPIHHMTPGANNSYHQPMYHQHDEFVTPIPPAGKGRGVMVAPPTVPPPGSNNTGTLSSTGSSNSDAVKFAIPANKTDFSVENKENVGRGEKGLGINFSFMGGGGGGGGEGGRKGLG